MFASTSFRARFILKGSTKYHNLIIATRRSIARREVSSLVSNNYFKESQIIPPYKNINAFSSSPTPPKQDEESSKNLNSKATESFAKDMLSKVITPQNQFYALVGGGTLGAYLISKGLLAFTNFFTHLNPAFVAKYGFYTGFGTATLLGSMALVTADNLYLRADPVYKYCYKWVRNDAQVQKALGDGIKAGNLTSYRIDSGCFRMKDNKPVWTPPRIQMVFDIEGTGPPYRTGLVTCEAIKPFGFPPKVQTTLLMVDYETGNEADGGNTEGDQTIFLVGKEDDLKHVSRRSGLSLEMLARQVHINKAAKECKK